MTSAHEWGGILSKILGLEELMVHAAIRGQSVQREQAQQARLLQKILEGLGCAPAEVVTDMIRAMQSDGEQYLWESAAGEG